MSSAFIARNMVTCNGIVTKPSKVSDLKMPGALIVGNVIIGNKNVNKAFVRAMFF